MTDTTSETAPAAATADVPAVPSEPGPANPAPDGQSLAYLQRDASGKLLLWLEPVAEGAARAVPLPFAPLPDAIGPQWSPDGKRLALTGAHPLGGRSAVWLVEVATDGAALLVDHAASDRAPRWSPDGERVALASTRDGRSAIAVAPATGEGPAIFLTDGAHDDDEPDWSHDGALIAFTRRVPGSLDQRDVCVVDLKSGAVTVLTTSPGVRHSPRFAPDRPQIIFVSEEGEWADISIVNAENKAGWIVAGEPGDKADPVWASDGGRLLYTRGEGTYVRCCVRGMSWANAETIDPGSGVASAPRWLADGRALYAFATPKQPAKFILQMPDANAERLERETALGWEAGQLPLVEPLAYEVEAGGVRLPGLIYRQSERAGQAPGTILLDAGPPAPHLAKLDLAAQLLANAGLTVLAPNLPGTTGLGTKVAYGLRDQADTEVEVADLADAASALSNFPDVVNDKIAIVGRGFGGALALLAAGGRPGTFQAVVAIDPILDWDAELDRAPSSWRNWLVGQLGLPAAHRGRYAMRTAATFAAVIDVPLLLLGTAGSHRQDQLAALAVTLQDLDVHFTRDTVQGDSEVAPFQRAAAFLREVFWPAEGGQ